MEGYINADVKGLIYADLKNKLLDLQEGTTYINKFLEKFMEEALADPTSKAGQTLASVILSKDTMNILSEANAKEMANNIEFAQYKLNKQLYPKEQELMNTVIHYPKTIAICTRRFGKTQTAANIAVQVSIKPNKFSLIVGLTFAAAIKQYWENVVEYADKAGLIIVNKNKVEGVMEFANGSSIKFVGNSNKEEADKLRGYACTGIVIIDEIGHQKYGLKYLIEDVISPMLQSDDSRLLLIGTPPRIPHHYSEYCWNNDSYRKFHASAVDNPYIKDFNQMIKDVCKEKGVDESNSLIRREYKGEFVYDMEAQIYKGYKTYKEFPKDFKVTDIFIGVDFGFEDFNGIVGLVGNKYEQKAYVKYEDKFNHAGWGIVKQHLVEMFNKLQKDYPWVNIRVVTDTNQPALAQELYDAGLPVEKAYKSDKMAQIQMIAEACRNGTFYIPEGGYCDDEFQQAVFKRDEATDAILAEVDDDAFHPDISDALQYAGRNMLEEFKLAPKHVVSYMGTEKVAADDDLVSTETESDSGVVWEDAIETEWE